MKFRRKSRSGGHSRLDSSFHCLENKAYLAILREVPFGELRLEHRREMCKLSSPSWMMVDAAVGLVEKTTGKQVSA